MKDIVFKHDLPSVTAQVLPASFSATCIHDDQSRGSQPPAAQHRIDSALRMVHVQGFYQAIYAEGAAAARYHIEETKDPEPEVSPWEGGVRTVKFRMMLNVPQMLKRVIGERAEAT